MVMPNRMPSTSMKVSKNVRSCEALTKDPQVSGAKQGAKYIVAAASPRPRKWTRRGAGAMIPAPFQGLQPKRP